MTALAHKAAEPMIVNGRARQLCRWCGQVLDDIIAAETMTVGAATIGSWSTEDWVIQDGGMTWTEPETEGQLHEDSCANLPVPDTNGRLR